MEWISSGQRVSPPRWQYQPEPQRFVPVQQNEGVLPEDWTVIATDQFSSILNHKFTSQRCQLTSVLLSQAEFQSVYPLLNLRREFPPAVAGIYGWVLLKHGPGSFTRNWQLRVYGELMENKLIDFGVIDESQAVELMVQALQGFSQLSKIRGGLPVLTGELVGLVQGRVKVWLSPIFSSLALENIVYPEQVSVQQIVGIFRDRLYGRTFNSHRLNEIINFNKSIDSLLYSLDHFRAQGEALRPSLSPRKPNFSVETIPTYASNWLPEKHAFSSTQSSYSSERASSNYEDKFQAFRRPNIFQTMPTLPEVRSQSPLRKSSPLQKQSETYYQSPKAGSTITYQPFHAQSRGSMLPERRVYEKGLVRRVKTEMQQGDDDDDDSPVQFKPIQLNGRVLGATPDFSKPATPQMPPAAFSSPQKVIYNSPIFLNQNNYQTNKEVLSGLLSTLGLQEGVQGQKFINRLKVPPQFAEHFKAFAAASGVMLK